MSKIQTTLALKKRVCIFIESFWPGYRAGGPTQSILNLSQVLNKQFDVFIITSDNDIGHKEGYEDLPKNEWVYNDILNVNIMYRSSEMLNYNGYKELFENEQFDYYYFNSLWHRKFTLLPVLKLLKSKSSEKIIIAPRGELNPGALNIKPVRKKILLGIIKIFRLYNRVIWHATNHIEQEIIKNLFGKEVDVRLMQNVPTQLQSPWIKKPIQNIKLVFISRISKMKNISFIIDILEKIDIKLHIDFYGMMSDEAYWNTCLQRLELLPQNITYNYLGSLNPKEISTIYKSYHFMILPTLGENFGHSIFESMINGVPVIISNNTPWQDLKDKKIGWDIDLNKINEWIEVINKIHLMTQEEYDVLSKSAYDFAMNYNHELEKEHRSLELFKN